MEDCFGDLCSPLITVIGGIGHDEVSRLVPTRASTHLTGLDDAADRERRDIWDRTVDRFHQWLQFLALCRFHESLPRRHAFVGGIRAIASPIAFALLCRPSAPATSSARPRCRSYETGASQRSTKLARAEPPTGLSKASILLPFRALGLQFNPVRQHHSPD